MTLRKPLRVAVRRRAIVAGAILLLACVMFPFARAVWAHEGHGTEEVGEYDLDAPRSVSPETAKHIGLKTAEIGTQPIEEVLEINGIVKALPGRRRIVAPRVAGKVVAVHKRVGDPVKRGELLAEIDSPEFARNLYEVRKLEVEYRRLLLQIEQRKATAKRLATEIDVAKAEVVYAEAERKRAESLLDQGLPQKEVALRELEATRAAGNLELKRIELALAIKEVDNFEAQAEALRLSRAALLALNNIEPEADLSKLTGHVKIRALMDAVVVHRDVMPGQWVDAGEEILKTADYAVVQIEGELPESLVPRVRARTSQKVRVRIPSEPSFLCEGIVRHIAPELDPRKRTAHLIIDAPNAEGVLRGEMWVRLSIVLRERKSALVVPRAAEVVHGPMHFVFLKNGDVYQKQVIVPGWRDDRFVEVREGLAPGDTIVIQGAYSLTHLRPTKPKKK